MKNKLLLILSLFAFSFSVSANNLKVGQPLPAVTVSDYGELLLTDGDISYTTWNSSELPGKVRIIQAIAGRTAAKELNSATIDAITAAKFPEGSYQTTTIVNQDDAVWGTGAFVKSSAKTSKEDFYWSSVVLDSDGKVQKAWQLEKKNSAIIVLDKAGKVLFVKEGLLSADEVKHAMDLVKAEIAKK
ncbi:YtfJ family protein [Vibrio sp. SS-MA-C1-2]|uniref:YtfJ family protein n=1 Tax=Vibrio sp. SS-MA-C1-2 TaxID=2908646 RepID=UPI001F17B401|nr:YtfJ family protein [Vibrio sp. SS-MA-C1-2]UJF19509.1 YtfJ family protein [Vibrio sp. SS-MA-C1-2]